MSIHPNLQKKISETDSSVLSINKLSADNLSEPGLSSAMVGAIPSKHFISSASDKKPDCSISLNFDSYEGRTRLASRSHSGQFYVQQPQYEVGPEICQVILLHVSGGVVGGDKLEVTTHVGAGAKAQLVSTGATKWYESNGHTSTQNVEIDVKAGGAMEWMPQETIFYDEAQVDLVHNVSLEADATYISCEIFCLGRTAHGESFDTGRIRQKVNIRRDNKLIWSEQLKLAGGSQAMSNSLIMADKTVCGTFIAASDTVQPRELIDALRESANAVANGSGLFGVSQVKSVIVARYLGDSSEVARKVMLKVWELLRPKLLGQKAVVPRMWNT